MKRYTAEHLKGFKNNEEGLIVCPAGDYTEIKSFPERCSFEAGCSFGERCRFAESCHFGSECRFEGGHIAAPGYPLLIFSGFGSANRTTYAFNCTDGIVIRCGCFSGSLEEFREKVRKRHENTPFAFEYLAVADLIERWFSRGGEVRLG